jgi:hypothetical protein
VTALYVVLGLVVVVAFAGMIPLRRYADRQWSIYLAEQAATRRRARINSWAVTMRGVGHHLREMERAARAFAPAMQRLGRALSERRP